MKNIWLEVEEWERVDVRIKEGGLKGESWGCGEDNNGRVCVKCRGIGE
jgi:hypothetical protein